MPPRCAKGEQTRSTPGVLSMQHGSVVLPACAHRPSARRRALIASLLAVPNPPSFAACAPLRIPLVPGGLLVREERGQARGVLVDLVAALERRLGCPVQAQLLPQQRLIQAFYVDYEADVLIPGSPAEFEGHSPHFVPLYKVCAQFAASAKRSWQAAQVAALPAQRWRCVLPLHVTYGADFDALVQRLDKQERVVWVRDVGTALRMVAAERVDYTLANPAAVYAYGGEALYRTFQFMPLARVHPMETGAAISRRSIPETQQLRVMAALQALVRDGDVDRAFARHFPADVLALEAAANRREPG